MTQTSLSGKRILVTAGPCREPIDPVRYISNRSSGKMGYALAEAAVDLGAHVTLVSGPTSLIRPAGVIFEKVETTQHMFEAVSRHFDRADCLIMAAAPADYRPAEQASQKIKKASCELKLILQPTVDILMSLSVRHRPDQVIVGFALETENGLTNAQRKLREKGLDLIVLNETSQSETAFDSDSNRVTIIRPNAEPEDWPTMSKAEISVRLLDLIATML